MTHLRIELNNIQENVSSAVIKKLYDIATSGTLDASSHLAGNLYVPATYLEYIDVLTDLTDPKFRDLTIIAGKTYLYFRDPEVFRVLMATGHIGDGVGITQSDCANYGDYTMYGAPYTIFQNNTTIEYFPELRYFTYWSNHTHLSTSTFNGCSNLKNIDITGWTSIPTAFVSGCPLSEFNILSLSGITYIGLFGFLNSGISGELSLPNLTNTDTNIFYGCTGLTKILSLGNITQVLSNSFRGCSNLTQVTLPSTCTTLEREAFAECTNLTSINTGNITQIGGNQGGWVFKNCSSLTSLDLSSVTTTSSYIFQGTNISNVVMPSIVSLGQTFTDASSVRTVDLGENLTSILALCFWGSGVTTIIFRGNTPPSFSDPGCGDKFKYDLSNLTIYVPDAKISDYQTALPGVASCITGISNLPQS